MISIKQQRDLYLCHALEQWQIRSHMRSQRSGSIPSITESNRTENGIEIGMGMGTGIWIGIGIWQKPTDSGLPHVVIRNLATCQRSQFHFKWRQMAYHLSLGYNIIHWSGRGNSPPTSKVHCKVCGLFFKIKHNILIIYYQEFTMTFSLWLSWD